MGKIISALQFTGRVGNFVAYRLPGVEGVVVRSKGSVSQKRYRKDPAFARTRELNAEFSGRAMTSSWIMRALHPQKPLGDYNIAGPINARLRFAQERDTESSRGQRSVQLSLGRELFEGFSLNRMHPFDTVVRAPLQVTVSRETRTATITLPALVPGINLVAPNKLPYFSIRLALGLVPDFFYTPASPKLYAPPPGYEHSPFGYADTSWLPAKQQTTPATLTAALAFVPPSDAFSLVVSVGICYGTLGSTGAIEQVNRAGSAKIIAVV